MTSPQWPAATAPGRKPLAGPSRGQLDSCPSLTDELPQSIPSRVQAPRALTADARPFLGNWLNHCVTHYGAAIGNVKLFLLICVADSRRMFVPVTGKDPSGRKANPPRRYTSSG